MFNKDEGVGFGFRGGRKPGVKPPGTVALRVGAGDVEGRGTVGLGGWLLRTGLLMEVPRGLAGERSTRPSTGVQSAEAPVQTGSLTTYLVKWRPMSVTLTGSGWMGRSKDPGLGVVDGPPGSGRLMMRRER